MNTNEVEQGLKRPVDFLMVLNLFYNAWPKRFVVREVILEAFVIPPTTG